jgi:hypothetical protein
MSFMKDATSPRQYIQTISHYEDNKEKGSGRCFVMLELWISIRDEGGGTSTKWTTKTLEGENKRIRYMFE